MRSTKLLRRACRLKSEDCMIGIKREYKGAILVIARDPVAASAPLDPVVTPLSLAFLAHELRTPLATLQGAAQTLVRRRGTLDGVTQDRLVLDIAAEAARLTLLVEDLLELCRPDGA